MIGCKGTSTISAKHAAQVLEEMDVYENAESPQPAFFDRQVANILAQDGRELAAWVYWFRGEVKQTQFIASGSYETHCDLR